MDACNKRQKIVNRSTGEITYRCMNKECCLHGQKVDEGNCRRCIIRPKAHSPCPSLRTRGHTASKKSPPVLPQEDMLDVTDIGLREMAASAGMDLDEIDKMQRAEVGQAEYPAYTVQLWAYKEALLRWVKAGRPVRTQEEVKEIHDTHCNPPGKPCEWYDPKQQRCKGCGCKVTVGSIAVFNKLKMATEHCPKEKF